MNEHKRQIPSVEQPQKSGDDSLEKLEEDTLDKQAKSASFRAAHEHSQHLSSLNTRIGVLQSKLDKREEELHRALPRVAELEQAKKTARGGAVVEAISATGGTIFLAFAPFVKEENAKYCLLGLGVASLTFAVFARAIYAMFGWPKNPSLPTTRD